MPGSGVSRRPHLGLSLIEILVVIGIIAILVAILVPAIVAARETARGAACKNNLRQIALAMSGHINCDKSLPGKNAWPGTLLCHMEQTALARAIAESEDEGMMRPAVYTCPSRPEDFLTDSAGGRSEVPSVPSNHYALVLDPDPSVDRRDCRTAWRFQDLGFHTQLNPALRRYAPELAWAAGNQMVKDGKGPHSSGTYHLANSQAAVSKAPPIE